MAQYYSPINSQQLQHSPPSVAFSQVSHSSSSSSTAPNSRWRKIIVLDEITHQKVASYDLDEKAHLTAKLQRQRRRNLGRMTGKKANLRNRKRALKKLEELFPNEQTSSRRSTNLSSKEQSQSKPFQIATPNYNIPTESSIHQPINICPKTFTPITAIRAFPTVTTCYIPAQSYYPTVSLGNTYRQPINQAQICSEDVHPHNFPIVTDLSSISWLLNKARPIHATEG